MAVPPEILAALQGGGGAPDMGGGMPPEMQGGGGGLPPEILAALGAGGGAEVADGPMGSLHGGGASEGDPEEHYREAIDHLELGIAADVDEARIQSVLQCVTKIQGELANSQKGMDSMLGGKMDPGMMRRAGAPEQAF